MILTRGFPKSRTRLRQLIQMVSFLFLDESRLAREETKQNHQTDMGAVDFDKNSTGLLVAFLGVGSGHTIDRTKIDLKGSDLKGSSTLLRSGCSAIMSSIEALSVRYGPYKIFHPQT